MSCSVSLILTLTRGTDILFEKLTPEEGVEFEKLLFHTVHLRVGFHLKPVFFFNIFSGDVHFDALIIGL